MLINVTAFLTHAMCIYLLSSEPCLANGQCSYKTTYVDQSFVMGNVARDQVQLGSFSSEVYRESVCARICVCACMRACVCVCACVHNHTLKFTCMYTNNTNTMHHKHPHTHTRTHTIIHALTHIHSYAHIHAHPHMYTCLALI